MWAEKQKLADASKLTLKQINDWFTNYRKRHWEDAYLAREAPNPATHQARCEPVHSELPDLTVHAEACTPPTDASDLGVSLLARAACSVVNE